ncbi:MAG TPA: ATP-binding protein [Vicinamibacterales bacterium]|nr:ATP-binding protein [Vicinamibacterales bacterium]
MQALASTDRLSELLPLLHQHAVDAIMGRTSIVFQFDPTGEWLQATSAFGIDRLPTEPWLADGGLVPNPLFRDRHPIFVADLAHSVRGVAEYLDTPSAVLVPLAHLEDRIGVLAVGCDQMPAAELLERVAPVGHAFALALERTRGARDADLQRDLRLLLLEFSRAVSSSFNLATGLETVCLGVNRLFASSRSSVWLHDRRARTMVLSASSDAEYLERARQVSTADALAPAAVALRRERAEIVLNRDTSPATALITVPLKGRRRALGTLVMEEVRLDPGSELELLERTEEMGRQLSAAIENVLLLEDVLQSRRELDNTFNSLSDLVIVCDRGGRVVHVNEAFSQRAGKTRTELLDRPLDELVGAGTHKLLFEALEVGPKGRSSEFNVELKDPSLEGTFLMTATPLLGDNDHLSGAVLVARDVTPHARLEAERADLRNKLVQSEKLAALGEFVAGIAHELNNPLQSVLGHIELLRATGAFPKTLRRDVQRIYREADRAAKIVRNLLVFAGSRRLVHRRVSINAVLSRVFALRGPALKAEEIEVVRHRGDDLPRVKGDPLLLQQAFLNIVLNAEQAIGSSGRIEASKTLLANPSRIMVEIRDTGPGIAVAVLPRIFEPFYTTKEVGKGTGLGLAIAYGIIQEHGGQIFAANHPDGGAIFTVQLPVEPTELE